MSASIPETHGSDSLASLLARLPEEKRTELLQQELTETEAAALEHDWRFWARPKQLPPGGDWRTWLVMAGRGWGKTRTGAEWVRLQVTEENKKRVAIVGPTAGDVRDVMVEGPSGLLSVFPELGQDDYKPSKRQVNLPGGAIAKTYSADEPARLRGPQHDSAWADEVGVWRYPDAWDMMMFGLRLGDDPRVCATTTPKPTNLVRKLVDSESTAITRGSTYENREWLAEPFMEEIVRQYEGTRLGRQELHGELLEDVPGALWSRELIEDARTEDHPPLDRVVVAVDPAVTSGEDSDMTGIVVCGKQADQGYVLEDATCRKSPEKWASDVVELYETHRADRVVAEVNNGGDLVENVLRSVDANLSYKSVNASRGKRVRAEPVSALYEQGRVHHVGGFAELEDQMCTFAPDQAKGADESPDRVDALVWAFTDLMLQKSEAWFV